MKLQELFWRNSAGQDDSLTDGKQKSCVREHVRFEGRVQRVGFRYETYRTATRLGLTGWVRNNSDGSVELEAQGGKKKVETLLRALQENPRFEIERMQRLTVAPIASEKGFGLS